jgi:hypothetical protein
MFDEILGLPVHPLVVHAAVVFIPLLSLVAVAYAVLPRQRGRLGWALVLLAVAAPIFAIVSRLSGETLVQNLFGGEYPEGVLGERVAEHADFAMPLVWATIALGVVSLLLVYAARRSGSAPEAGAGSARRAAAGAAGNTTVTMVLSVVTIVFALVALYFVARTGHSGAMAVWGR